MQSRMRQSTTGKIVSEGDPLFVGIRNCNPNSTRTTVNSAAVIVLVTSSSLLNTYHAALQDAIAKSHHLPSKVESSHVASREQGDATSLAGCKQSCQAGSTGFRV